MAGDSMNKELIQEVLPYLAVMDVYLVDFKFEKIAEYHPRMLPEEEELGTQDRLSMTAKEISISQDGEDQHILVTEADLGVRFVEKLEDGIQPLFALEATFRAEYLMKRDGLSEEALKEFSQYNGLHTIWPFWRQFVYDIMPRLRLPVPEVPLMRPIS